MKTVKGKENNTSPQKKHSGEKRKIRFEKPCFKIY